MLRFSKEIFWYQHQQFKENNENDMAAQVFLTAFYSSRWQSQIGPTADFDGAAFYIFRDSNFVPTIWKL